jgi:hypothetical protein
MQMPAIPLPKPDSPRWGGLVLIAVHKKVNVHLHDELLLFSFAFLCVSSCPSVLAFDALHTDIDNHTIDRLCDL